MESTTRKYKKHKTAYKVGISYFLNEQSKPIIISGEQTYPLYVSIRVQRQNTKIRSRTGLYSTKDKIEQLLSSTEALVLIEAERASIERSIRSLEPDKNEDFTMKNWMVFYEIGLVSLSECITDTLNTQLFDHLVQEYGDSMRTYRKEFLEAKQVKGGNSNRFVTMVGETILHLLNQLGYDKSSEFYRIFHLLRCYGLYQKTLNKADDEGVKIMMLDKGFLGGECKGIDIGKILGYYSTNTYDYCLWDYLTDSYDVRSTDAMYGLQNINDIYGIDYKVVNAKPYLVEGFYDYLKSTIQDSYEYKHITSVALNHI